MREIKDVVIRPATTEDFRHFYPDGAPRTSYSWIAMYKGKPAALAGLIIERGGCVVYLELDKGCGASKLTIWRSTQVMMKHIKALGLPMHTGCDKLDESAQAFVQRLGFVRQRNFQGMEFFTWQA